MDWHYLGHAMWLADLGDVRILFDPLIDGLHHGGVFEVEPPRSIDVSALRPDFVVVSHQHSDHFDVPSLRALAQLDPDTVVMTADTLVEQTARRLGFRTVVAVETFSRIDLNGARLASTPSYTGDAVEWGMLVETRHGVAWNQIDSYHPRPEQVQTTLASASKIFERDLTEGLALAFVRWQPVLETQGPLGERPGFPFEEYAQALARIAATRARAVVPAAAGVRQTAPYAFMNHYVYPVPQRRVLRDLVARVPGIRAFPATIGGTYSVRDGEPGYDPKGAHGLVTVPTGDPGPIATMFRPYEMPAVVDPNPDGQDETAMRVRVARWMGEDLAPALAANWSAMRVRATLRFVVEVVFPSHVDVFTIAFDAHGARVSRELDDDFDAMNTIAGSLLVDVIEGRRQWGDPLLGGMLRAVVRAYDMNEEGLLPATVSPTFLYYAIGYDESVRRATEWQVKRAMGEG